MEPDVTQSALFYKLWAWGDKSKKQLLWGLIGLALVGMVVAVWLVHKNETQNDANYALSKLMNPAGATTVTAPTADSLLKVASDYPGTDASQRALLLAAGDHFAAGKYDVAQAEFEKFVQQNNGSPLVSQAALGAAACYDAQGKTNDAVSAYENVVNRYQGQNVVPQAKLSLGRLQEGQGKFKEARAAYEELTRSIPGTISSEAALRLQELNAAHPETPPTNALSSVATPALQSLPAMGAVTNLKTPGK